MSGGMVTTYLDCIQRIIYSYVRVDFVIFFFHFTNPAIDDMNVILMVFSSTTKWLQTTFGLVFTIYE